MKPPYNPEIQDGAYKYFDSTLNQKNMSDEIEGSLFGCLPSSPKYKDNHGGDLFANFDQVIKKSK